MLPRICHRFGTVSTIPRLSLVSLAEVSRPPGVELPRVDPQTLSIGIVHLGVGAFHRAHQAIFTEDAAAALGQTNWGILGVTGRSDTVVRQLAPQDGLYGVLTKGADATSLRVVGSLRDIAWPGDRSADVVRALAAPTTHVITLTMTEKGYLRGPGGGVDVTNVDLAHDLAMVDSAMAGVPVTEPSRTLLGLLVRGLALRFVSSRAPVSVVSCDNLTHNGAVVRAVVASAIATLREPVALLSWLDSSVAFPSTMVDRITPATTEPDREEAMALLGLRDAGLVVAEPFRQWVIEDAFASERPRWELAGAILTSDVGPYEDVKLRILNATHSLLAYLGALMGYRTIAEAIADPALRAASMRMITEDVLPTLAAPAGIDLAEYRDATLTRFANPNLAHTTAQVAMDGSQKLPQRLIPTISDRLAAGAVPHHLALLTAAWITYIASTDDLADPMAERLRAAVPSANALYANPGVAVQNILAIETVFPPNVRDSQEFGDAVTAQLAVVRKLVSGG